MTLIHDAETHEHTIHWYKVVEKVVNAVTPAASSIPCSGRSENSGRKQKANLAVMRPFFSGTSTT